MQADPLGIIFIVVGIILFVINPRLRLELKRGKLRGIAGPVLVIIGILILTGVISGIN